MLACCLGFGERLQADMTLLQREMFAPTGALTAASPGTNFASVVGTLAQRAGGPRLAGSPAASADLRGDPASAYGCFVLPTQILQKVFVGAWFMIKSIQGSDKDLLNVCDIYGNPGPTISITNGSLGGGIRYNSFASGGPAFVNRWVFLGIAVNLKQGTTGDVRFYFKLPGQPMQSWGPINNGQLGVASLGQVTVGAVGVGTVLQGRMGGVSVYSFTQADFSDVAYPADLLEPITGLTWYCNALNGNDAADGTTPATAWKSVAKINDESNYTGMLPADNYANGDTLIIDTSGQALDLGGLDLALRTPGLNVRAATGQQWIVLKSYRSLAPAGWTPTGTANVYAITDSQPNIVLWENDMFMNHPLGSSFSAVSAALSSTPGSFWTDGTTLYVHPFGSTDPRVDGKRYERSYAFPDGASVALGASNLNVQDIYTGKTCLTNPATNDPVGTTCMSFTAVPGIAVVRHCYLYMGAKHNFSITLGGYGDDVLVEDVQSEQGSPYAPPGGQTVFVSFNADPVAYGITHRFHNCRTVANAGLIGSSQGVMLDGLYPVYFIHNLGNTGEPQQFNLIEIVGCDFGRGNIQGNYGAKSFVVSQTTCGGIWVSSQVSADRCYFNALNWQDSPWTLTERNCVHVVTGYSGELRSNPVGGSLDIQGCTFDARQITGIQGGVPQSALFTRNGPLSLVFQNNLVLMPSTPVQANVFSNLQSTDNIQMSHNAYSLGGNTLVYQYNNGAVAQNCSLAQWQSLGFDTGSFQSSSMNLSGLIPTAGSPLINAGLILGPLQDYSGAMFRLRNDIGAYEAYPSSYALWQAENFTTAEMAQPNRVGGTASYLGDGVPNLLKYAEGLNSNAPAAAALPQLSVQASAPGGPVMTVGYQRSHWAGDVTLQLQFSQDLIHWSAVTAASQQVIATGTPADTLSAVLQLTPPAFWGFVRLQAVQP